MAMMILIENVIVYIVYPEISAVTVVVRLTQSQKIKKYSWHVDVIRVMLFNMHNLG